MSSSERRTTGTSFIGNQKPPPTEIYSESSRAPGAQSNGYFFCKRKQKPPLVIYSVWHPKL
jgi:hypothetical protein